MPDRYAQLVNTPIIEKLADLLGLPKPIQLRRYEPGQPLLEGPALVGGAKGGRLQDRVVELLEHAGVHRGHRAERLGHRAPLRRAGLRRDRHHRVVAAGRAVRLLPRRPSAGWATPAGMVVLGTPPDLIDAPAERTAQRSLEGFVRSAGQGGPRRRRPPTLIHVAEGAEDGARRGRCGSCCRPGRRSSTARSSPSAPRPTTTRSRRPTTSTPLDGKVAVVTGAARGIGEAIARTLARDGAHVVCLDLPASGQPLSKVANDGRRVGAAARHHRPGRPGAPGRPPHRPPRRRRHRGPQRRRHPRQDAGRHGRQALEHGASTSTCAPRSASTTTCSTPAPSTRAAASCACRRCRASPATAARPTTRPRRPA